MLVPYTSMVHGRIPFHLSKQNGKFIHITMFWKLSVFLAWTLRIMQTIWLRIWEWEYFIWVHLRSNNVNNKCTISLTKWRKLWDDIVDKNNDHTIFINSKVIKIRKKNMEWIKQNLEEEHSSPMVKQFRAYCSEHIL